MIDEDSLERYGKEPGEFGKILRNSIDWEEECFYQNNRRCAFFNDENLCDLYKTLGPDALCDTCRMYLYPVLKQQKLFCPAKSQFDF